ncbi:MAG: TrkA C-terminal domain-containing protein [Candidatus Omnitrophota bacterium]
MSIFIFIVAIIISYLVVRIGAAAFELTGLDTEQSHFQSLSAFSGTGFTTREAELIVMHKQRRKIASVLMILGNAGLVTLVATLVNSIRPDAPSFVLIPALSRNIPNAFLPYINLMIILIFLYLVYRLFRSSRLSRIFMQKIQQRMIDKKFIQPACFEELLLNSKGYGVSQIELTEKNPLSGKTLAESKLREHDILVLSVERGDEHIVNPTANIKFKPQDRLVCFGKIENIRDVAYEEAP